MSYLSVQQRRAAWAANDAADDNVAGWVCERCGDDCEEGLCVYSIDRATRARSEGVVACLCEPCADRTAGAYVVAS